MAEHIGGKAPEDQVFPASRGGYLRSSNFRRGCWDKATVTVGLGGLVPHELRHTAASLAIRSGANIKVVQTMMGHASATMTWDLYGHLYDDDLNNVAERLDTPTISKGIALLFVYAGVSIYLISPGVQKRMRKVNIRALFSSAARSRFATAPARGAPVAGARSADR